MVTTYSLQSTTYATRRKVEGCGDESGPYNAFGVVWALGEFFFTFFVFFWILTNVLMHMYYKLQNHDAFGIVQAIGERLLTFLCSFS
jgi:hypothetical protein